MRTTHVEAVMGTAVSFDVRSESLGPAALRAAVAAACRVLHEAEAVFSTHRAASPMSRLRRGELTVDQCPPEVAAVLTACARAREATAGWFDADAMPGGTDPTGLVKGWAAQQALDELVSHGVSAALVNAGGDAVAVGRPEPDRPWRLAVRDPFDPARWLCIVPLADAALATSGTYERGAHVLDPRSGAPASAGAVSASVTGPDLTVADALATALVAGGELAVPAVSDVAGYAALLVLADRRLLRVGDFPAQPLPSAGPEGRQQGGLAGPAQPDPLQRTARG
jgi:thiamine biosynthesis lipoprotein